MRRRLDELSSREFDVVVVGGGIFGAALAHEAAARDLSVALVERGDFCEGTSANSYKVVHGGIRYLQHLDVARIRESSRERSTFLRVAPHLVRPLPIVIPTYAPLMKSRLAMRFAMPLYNLLTFDRNRDVPDPVNRIPAARTVSRAECLALCPGLDPEGVTGGAVFHDGQMYNPTRLALGFVRSAVEAGAEAANYAEVLGFLRRGDAVGGVRVEDRLTGDAFDLRGRAVVNAAGPWAPELLRGLDGVALDPEPTFSRDACFVVPRRLMGDVAVAVQGATKDPDAVLSRGARHLFVVPWRDYTLVGVWHVVHRGDPDAFTVTERDLESFLAEINGAVPGLGLTQDDVSLWNAGLVLFGENRPGAKDLSYGHRSLVVDHARSDGVEGLVTVIGVRYTTARGVAARAMDLVCGKLGRPPLRPPTDRRPTFGGDYDDFASLTDEARRRTEGRLDDRLLVPLLRNYGSRYEDVLRHSGEDSAGFRPLGASTTLRAELVHAVREEMALDLTDVVFRRTDLATGAYPGDDTVREAAAVVGRELGWSADRAEDALARVRSRFWKFRNERAIPAAGRPGA